jgi:hypothetical protein
MKHDVSADYATAMAMGIAAVLVFQGGYTHQEAYAYIKSRLPQGMPRDFSIPYKRIYSPRDIFFRVEEENLEPLINGMESALVALEKEVNQAIAEVRGYCVYAKGEEVWNRTTPFK